MRKLNKIKQEDLNHTNKLNNGIKQLKIETYKKIKEYMDEKNLSLCFNQYNQVYYIEDINEFLEKNN